LLFFARGLRPARSVVPQCSSQKSQERKRIHLHGCQETGSRASQPFQPHYYRTTARHIGTKMTDAAMRGSPAPRPCRAAWLAEKHPPGSKPKPATHVGNYQLTSVAANYGRVRPSRTATCAANTEVQCVMSSCHTVTPPSTWCSDSRPKNRRHPRQGMKQK